MAHGRARRILFRIFYSTSFTIVFLLTVAFACAGPIDVLYQSYRRGRLIDMFLIGAIYVLTGLLAGFLYASRLYSNRSLLKDIPKTYMPIDKMELPVKKVWRLVEDCKNRSAVIAYLARPRSRRVEVEVSYAQERINTLLKPEHSKHTRIFEPQWGVISHPGWSSPAAKETPNLDYSTVVAELTDLIEARAVSLAPVDPEAERDDQGIANADESIVEALRRPEEAGMRQYFSQLISLDVLQDNSLSVAFLTLYERARFANEPLSEDEFRSLMRMFAEILRTMRTLDVSRMDISGDYPTQLDDKPTAETSKSPSEIQIARNLGATVSTSSLASSIAGSVRHHMPYDRSPSLTSSMPLPATTAVPRISHDSVRSISSHEMFADAEGSSSHQNSPDNTNTTWTQPTSRPPFFRARSSNHSSRTNQSQARSQVQSRNSRRARMRQAVSRKSFESTATGGSRLSLRSARSNGSVIRLNPEFERGGSTGRQSNRDVQPYEYTGVTAEEARRTLARDNS